MASYEIGVTSGTAAVADSAADSLAAIAVGRLTIVLTGYEVADPDTDITATYGVDDTGNPHVTITFADIQSS